MKKTLITALVLLLCLAMPITAMADSDTISVYVTIAVAGEFAEDTNGNIVVSKEIETSDVDGDGAITLNDAFVSAHEQLAPNGSDDYASYESQYGTSIAKLWGDESGAFGYCVNNVPAMSAGDSIKDGDRITAYVYADTVNYSDSYTWFTQYEIPAEPGEEVTLSLKTYTYDANWNAVESPCVGAELTVYKDGNVVTSGTTDENGNESFVFEDGLYVIMATAADGSYIVPAACTVLATANSLPSYIWILLAVVVIAAAAVAFTVVNKKKKK